MCHKLAKKQKNVAKDGPSYLHFLISCIYIKTGDKLLHLYLSEFICVQRLFYVRTSGYISIEHIPLPCLRKMLLKKKESTSWKKSTSSYIFLEESKQLLFYERITVISYLNPDFHLKIVTWDIHEDNIYSKIVNLLHLALQLNHPFHTGG